MHTKHFKPDYCKNNIFDIISCDNIYIYFYFIFETFSEQK